MTIDSNPCALFYLYKNHSTDSANNQTPASSGYQSITSEAKESIFKKNNIEKRMLYYKTSSFHLKKFLKYVRYVL